MKYDIGDEIFWADPLLRKRQYGKIANKDAKAAVYILHSGYIIGERYVEGRKPKAFTPTTDYDIVTDWPNYELADPQNLPKHLTKECECGAKHTSFPNDHLSFCPMND